MGQKSRCVQVVQLSHMSSSCCNTWSFPYLWSLRYILQTESCLQYHHQTSPSHSCNYHTTTHDVVEFRDSDRKLVSLCWIIFLAPGSRPQRSQQAPTFGTVFTCKFISFLPSCFSAFLTLRTEILISTSISGLIASKKFFSQRMHSTTLRTFAGFDSNHGEILWLGQYRSKQLP